MSITTEQVKGALDVKSASALVKSAQREYAKAEQGRYSATVSAALATHAAYATGILRGRGEGAGEMTQGEYAAGFAVSQSLVNYWRTVGHAVVVVGIVADSETGRLLIGKNGANYADVREAVLAAGEGETADIVSALSTHFLPDGTRRTAANRVARPNTGEQGQGEQGPEQTPDVQVSLALKVLRDNVSALDAEAFAKFETDVQAILAREIGMRASAAKSAAKRTVKKAATRAA